MRTILRQLEQWVPKPLRGLGTHYYEMLPAAIRYGRVYRDAVKFLEQSQFWAKEQHDEYQLKMLHLLLAHAVSHVPFYRDLYQSHKIQVEDVRSVHDVQYLPTVQKTDLQTYLQQIKTENYPSSKFQYHTTGGSTGRPVGLYWESDRTVPLERAFIRRQWNWAGFDIDHDRSVILRGIPTASGKTIEKISNKKLRLSTYHLTPAIIEQYIKAIQDFKAVAIQAYPSAAYIVAQYILERGGTKFPSLKIVLCGSENMYDWQRNIIEQAFGCKTYSWYGLSEYVALAGECKHSRKYHCYSEYGITEIIKENGQQSKGGESGEIIATGFNNFAFPLIRYRTQDVATVSSNQQCQCGRNYLLLDRIEGRLQEMMVSKNGNLISMTAINMHSDVFDNLYQFQFYQDTPGKLIMKQVRRAAFSQEDDKKINYELQQKIGDQFDVECVAVDSIETTERGKSRFLIQKIPIENRGFA
ncbi:MAG: phenylacetate--CoA ligase family protein [Chlorobi bacterium]|nr:phenylacetate--CoA ligase family protein [Chlorobiota bacterium]